MKTETCPFCKCDPYHRVDNGVWMEPVAINCCEAGYDYYTGSKIHRQIVWFRQSHSPRKKARAKRLFDLYVNQD